MASAAPGLGDFGFGQLSGSYAGTPDPYTLPSQTYNDAGRQIQMDMLERYRQQALGLGGPSPSEQFMADASADQQAASLQLAAMGRGGNLQGMQRQALSQSSGIAADTQANAQVLQAMQQQQAMEAYAGLGNQIAQQGLGYGGLATNQAAFNRNLMADWYRTERGLNQRYDLANRDMNVGLAKAGVAAGGAAIGAIGSM